MWNRNLNYVCFTCRTAYRRAGTAICAMCQKPTICVGFRWRVPKKEDDKAWKIMEDKYGPKPEAIKKESTENKAPLSNCHTERSSKMFKKGI